MADKITFSWSVPGRPKPVKFRPMRVVKRNGVDVARVARSQDDTWYWYITSMHRGEHPAPKNTLAEGVTFVERSDAEADVRTWLREHPAVGVPEVKT